MVDRAGPFLASRSLTALIVIALVGTAFAGLFIVGEKAAADGDLIIGDETYVIQGVDQLVDGNVVVGTDGVLKVIDGSLSIISNFGERFTVTIGSGGTLILDHGVLTTYPDQIDPWARLDLVVEDQKLGCLLERGSVGLCGTDETKSHRSKDLHQLGSGLQNVRH